MIEVYHLNFPADLAERHADGPGYSPLKTSKAECLATARDGGYLRGSHGPIALRGGETARLSVGWTRARLNAYEEEGRIVPSSCADTFNGLRVSVSSHVTGGEQGTWELSAFVSTGGLSDDKAAHRYGQSSEASHVEATTPQRLALSTTEAAWLVRVETQWAPHTQVLICARLADL